MWWCGKSRACRSRSPRRVCSGAMKAVTHRAKDEADLVFLRHWFTERGRNPRLSGENALGAPGA